MSSRCSKISRIDTDLFLIHESGIFTFWGSENESYDEMIKLLELNCNRLISEYQISLDSRINVEIYPSLEIWNIPDFL